MRSFVTALLFALLATQTSAQACPDKYRFVDFGAMDREGILRRGGTVFRAFDAQNTHLLKRKSVVCHAVEENAVDGRALKIPVVSKIEIDTEIAKLDILGLLIEATENAVADAEKSAARHQAVLTDANITKGDTYLCASTSDTTNTSCQHVSPYLAKAPLVTYCDAQICEIPVLALNDGIFITASWTRVAQTQDALGQEISEKLGLLDTFLQPHVSASR